MAGVAGELEDVPLGDAQVLENLPRGMLGAPRLFAAQIGGEVFDGLIEVRVSVAAVEKIEHVLAQRGVAIHRFSLLIPF